MPNACKGIDPAAITSRAALARLPVLRKSELPALHKAAPPFGGFVAGASWLVRAAVYLARPDLRAGSRPRRSLARRAGAVRGRFSARRRGAQHLQLSPDPRRLHLRCLGARARLRRHPGRSRQYRSAVRVDRGLSSGRLQRHAGFSENPARRRRKRRARRLLDQARAGVGRRVSEIAAGGDQDRAASTPIRRSAPPISAWSPTRRRRARAWPSTRT